ncbi:hypothetical protein HNY73_010501 [Argiope bruennichi]|uniref:Uncharacterized protein n=1 Tax=Argiope bruennichi TaxID=94029 RepID=A0A8T0F657_ARGBR|nr:hypothetical protein HNY73_010501 [Argiope bruennichi]
MQPIHEFIKKLAIPIFERMTEFACYNLIRSTLQKKKKSTLIRLPSSDWTLLSTFLSVIVPAKLTAETPTGSRIICLCVYGGARRFSFLSLLFEKMKKFFEVRQDSELFLFATFDDGYFQNWCSKLRLLSIKDGGSLTPRCRQYPIHNQTSITAFEKENFIPDEK